LEYLAHLTRATVLTERERFEHVINGSPVGN